MTTERKGPLSRFKVIDLTRARAGPTAARHFADFGADVIKVEMPVGDEEALGGEPEGAGLVAVFLQPQRSRPDLAHLVAFQIDQSEVQVPEDAGAEAVVDGAR